LRPGLVECASAEGYVRSQRSRRGGDVGVKAKGFDSPNRLCKDLSAAVSNVAEPIEGWPTLSVIILSSESRVAGSVALEQLAVQDYPIARIREIIIDGAEDLSSGAPEALRPLLRDFKQAHDDTLSMSRELQACSGDFVAFWGDDHVSAPSRLRLQVAAAMEGPATTVLQHSWFFDPVTSDFLQVRKWPVTEIKEYMGLAGDEVLPEGFAELMVCTDPLTLCGKRDSLSEAASGFQPTSSPAEGLKELLLRLLRVQKPRVIKDLKWAAVRPPPAATRYEPATPEAVLVQIAQTAWPRGAAGIIRATFDEAIKDIQSAGMKPAGAVDRLLSEDARKPLKQFDVERVRRVVLESLARATPGEFSEAIKAMRAWPGLVHGRGDAKAARNFPVFYAVFRAIRSHVADNADFFDMRSLGDISEDLVKLAMSMWASDEKVNEALAKVLSEELIGNDVSDLPTDNSMKTADIVGTLGLRDPLSAMAYAALDLPEKKFPVDALASFAWALAEAGVENAALQIKVAKAIISGVDKLTPPDIGKLFIAMHEKKWFKDETSIAYLTESLMGQIQTLKRDDPGLAKILASA